MQVSIGNKPMGNGLWVWIMYMVQRGFQDKMLPTVLSNTCDVKKCIHIIGSHKQF